MSLRKRYDWNRSQCGRFNRVMSWLLVSIAAFSWPLATLDAFRDHDWTITLAALIITGSVVMHRVVLRKVYGVSELAPPEPRPNFAPNKPTGVTPPDGRLPVDTSRPYPRPKGGRRKLDQTCPVCGTGDTTGSLDGRVLGWRAHGSCAEWLGDWKPRRPAPPPFNPDRQLIGYVDQGQKGARSISVGGNLAGIASTGDAAVNLGGAGGGSRDDSANYVELVTNGRISADEARTRILGEMFGSFGVPAASLGYDATEQRLKPPGAPVITEYCTCGYKFTGTAEWIRRELDIHHASGGCPHTAKGRQSVVACSGCGSTRCQCPPF